LALLPAWVQTVSKWLPLTRGIAAARALIDGAPYAQIAPLLTQELLIGIAYILVGYVLFRWFERQARRRGTLEMV
jgi:ABC-type uncharacterized transport system permease subunit